jgi:hypothetical protein
MTVSPVRWNCLFLSALAELMSESPHTRLDRLIDEARRRVAEQLDRATHNPLQSEEEYEEPY